MLNDTNIDKILQRQQNGNIYLLHIVATNQRLSIEIQDKLKGDIWAEQFTLQKIQQITLKAKNAKKYPIFIKMLMSSLLAQTESVLVQILTYAQLQRKMNLARGRNSQTNNKKFIIMTYLSQFDKTHYPLPLNFVENPPVERLKITIRRLSQELTLNAQERDQPQSYQAKQFSMLKYQNETLKTRIKTLEQRIHTITQGSENLMDKSNLINEQKQTKKQLQGMKQLLNGKEEEIVQLRNKLKELTTDNDKKQNLIIDLKQQLNDYKEERNQKRQQLQTYALVEEKINEMNKQTAQLVSQLQFFKQKDKKNSLKIQNLQKQLEKMMNLQQKKRVGGGGTLPNVSSLAFSRKAPSQKSFHSQKSQKSNQSGRSNNSKTKGAYQGYTNKPNQPINRQTTKRSIYDSDTQSSKMRKANNTKVSPFRQPVSKPSGNVSNSSKKVSNNFTSTMNRFERNILASSRDRSRSKSRSVKKHNSPPAEIPTDNFGSSSEDDKITDALTKLKERKNRVRGNDGKNENEKGNNKGMGPLERKITNIAEMLRKAKSRQGRD